MKNFNNLNAMRESIYMLMLPYIDDGHVTKTATWEVGKDDVIAIHERYKPVLTDNKGSMLISKLVYVIERTYERIEIDGYSYGISVFKRMEGEE